MLLLLLLFSCGRYTTEAFTVSTGTGGIGTGTGTTFRPWTTTTAAYTTKKTNLRSLGNNYLDTISSSATSSSSSSSYFPSPSTTVGGGSVGGLPQQYDYVVGVLGDLRT